MKILVTGGAGYIGAFTAQLLQKHHEPVIVDNRSVQNHAKVTLPFHEVDLRHADDLDKVFAQEKFEAVIHFASLALAGESMEKPGYYYHHNLTSTLQLLDMMVKHKVKKIVFSSTCAIFGTPHQLPVTENSPIHPESVYGSSKAMIEQILQFYSQIYGLQYVALRYFNACGAALDGTLGEDHAPETHLIPKVIQAALEQQEFSLYGNDYPTPDGTCIRDYIHVLDLAMAHQAAIDYLSKHETSNAFNLGTGKGHSNLDVIKCVEAATGSSVKINWKPRRVGDPAIIYADPTKANTVLHWHPQHSDMTTIVKSALAWHTKQHSHPGYSI